MLSNPNSDVVLSVTDVVTQFDTADGRVHAVNGVSFDVREGELLGVVGESGCGKTVTMMSLVKLLPMPPGKIVGGSALFEGQDLIQADIDALQKIRGGRIGFIFQDPMTSLNPVLTVGYQLTEALRLHKSMCRSPLPDNAPWNFLSWSEFRWQKTGSMIIPINSPAVCASAS